MSNIYEKLQTARVTLQNKKLKKTGKNKFSGFTYFELADFMPAINQIFLDLKICSNFSIKDKTAVLEIINSETPEEKSIFMMPTCDLELKGCTAIQALGGVNTYCRRYLYLNALEIVESDLLDIHAGKLEEQPTKKDDTAIYEKVSHCQTVEELESLWKTEHKNVEDVQIFKDICASRKSVILEQL